MMFMKIALIGAMKIEIDGLVAALSQPSAARVGGIQIHSGRLYEIPVCIAACDPGKVNAAICAQTLWLNEHPTEMISLGVAGGTRCLKIGQAAIADSLVQHDVDTTAVGDPLGFLSGLGVVSIQTDPSIREGLYQAALRAQIPGCRSRFATGDQFVSPARLAQIKSQFNADVAEMEAGAIAQVCYRAQLPFGALRVISDNGDAQADYETFKFEAARLSMQILSEYLSKKKEPVSPH